jgi:ferredoxin
MRLRTDVTGYQGHGRGYDLAPGLFRPDGEGQADLIEAAEEIRNPNEANVRVAARLCPEPAVTLEP